MKPLDPLGSSSLLPNEKKLAEALLAQFNDDSYVHFLGKIEKKKYKIEKRILIITSHKIICMKPSGKLARESHLLDLYEIRSSEPTELELIFKAFTVFLPNSDAAHIITIVNAIRRAFEANFTESPTELRPKLFIKHSTKFAETQPRDVKTLDSRPCKGFISTYRSLCVYRNVPIRLDVCWDLAYIHARKGRTKLNLNHFQQPLTPDDIRVLLETLRFNSYFTVLSLTDLRFEGKEKDLLVTSISEALRFNTSLTKLNLRGIGASAHAIVMLSESLALNKHVSLVNVDLSNNPIEDKGMVSFAGYLQHTAHMVTHLKLSGCGIASKGIVAAAVGFSTNPNIANHLVYLSLSNNKLGQEACKSLYDWLSKPVQLTHLMLSNTTTSDNLEILIAGVTKGCGQLSVLDISSNMIEKESSKAIINLIKTGSCSQQLNFLDLTNTQLPIDSLKEIMKIARGNLSIKENNLSYFPGAQMINSIGSKIEYITQLDLSDNDLGDEGIQLIAQGLCNNSSVTHLVLNGNFKSPKTRAIRVSAIDALIALLRSPCPLKKLELAAVGNPALIGFRSKDYQLRQDLLPLLAVISLNTQLTSLDVTGHQMGNKGATALGKALQINHTLLHLAWDENGTTLTGLSYFSIGMQNNQSLVHMPLPLSDINQAMKSTWENGGPNDKLLQVVRKIELRIFKNSSTNSSIRLPASFNSKGTSEATSSLSTEKCAKTDDNVEGGNTREEVDELEQCLGETDWSWTESDDGINSVPSSHEQF